MASALGTRRPPGRRKASSGRPRGRGGRHRWGFAREIQGRAGNQRAQRKSRREQGRAGNRGCGRKIERQNHPIPTKSRENRKREGRTRGTEGGGRTRGTWANLGRRRPLRRRASPPIREATASCGPASRHICWSAAPAPQRRRAARAPLHLFCWSTAAGPRPRAALRKTAMAR